MSGQTPSLALRTPESGVSQVNVNLQANLSSSGTRLFPEVSELTVTNSIRDAQLDSQVRTVVVVVASGGRYPR